MKKKLIIIEDMPLLNSMLEKILTENFDVVACSSNAKDMDMLCNKYKPDIILTDVVTKDKENGIYYGGKIKEKYGNKIKVLAITGVPEISFLSKAKEYKLDGLIYKDINNELLISNINQVINGYTVFPDNYNFNKDSDKFKKLTDKEYKILCMLCNGIEREVIADELNITLGTLKNYISVILDKMEFDSISKLTIFSISNGYIVPDIN